MDIFYILICTYVHKIFAFFLVDNLHLIEGLYIQRKSMFKFNNIDKITTEIMLAIRTQLN